MLELTLRVRAQAAEQVFDAVLPALPGGLHMRERDEEVEMTVLEVEGCPSEAELRELAGEGLIELTTAEASDDWRERRLARYEPLVIADRFQVRPEWAPPGEDASLIEIVLASGGAFGTGLHPTTQACLAALAEAPAGGSFADHGCGTGVLSLAAAKLGFSPVHAIDVNEQSVSVTRDNATRNGVEVDARCLDVTAAEPPTAATVAANVPPAIHLKLAERLGQAPALLIASGFQERDAEAVTQAWGAHGLAVADEVRAHEWIALVMR